MNVAKSSLLAAAFLTMSFASRTSGHPFLTFQDQSQTIACSKVRAPAAFKMGRTRPGSGERPVNAGIAPAGFVELADGTPTIHGIDVSKYQDEADFKSVAECGGRFAYVRMSAGTDPDNELLYRTHWANVRASGLVPGPYHNLSVVPATTGELRTVPETELQSRVDQILPYARASATIQAKIFLQRLNEVTSLDPRTGTTPPPYLPIAVDLSSRPFAEEAPVRRLAVGRVYGAMVCRFLEEVRGSADGRRPAILFIGLADYDAYGLAQAPCDLTAPYIWVRHRPADGTSFRTNYPAAVVERICARRPTHQVAARGDGTASGSTGRCIMEQYSSYGGFAVFRPGAPLDLNRLLLDEEGFGRLLARGG